MQAEGHRVRVQLDTGEWVGVLKYLTRPCNHKGGGGLGKGNCQLPVRVKTVTFSLGEQLGRHLIPKWHVLGRQNSSVRERSWRMNILLVQIRLRISAPWDAASERGTGSWVPRRVGWKDDRTGVTGWTEAACMIKELISTSKRFWGWG